MKISILLYSLMLVSCNRNVDYKFLHSTNEINAIEIVKVNGEFENNELKQEKIYDVENIESFLGEFEELDCSYIYTDPQGIEGEEVVIKIIYKNREYELIGAGGQATYTNEKKLKNYKGRYCFEKEQFEALVKIEKFDVEDYSYFIAEFSSDEVLGSIDNAQIAKEKAEMIWLEKYGQDVKKEKPYHVYYDMKNGVWLVTGTMPCDNADGGVAYILIEKADGKVMAVWHDK